MPSLRAALANNAKPGVFRYHGQAKPESICRDLPSKSYRCFYLDGATIHDKADFLRACSDAMFFPSYAGHNWDALDECITDLSWVPAEGYVLLYDNVARFAQNEPEQWSVALDTLRTACEYWQHTSTPMYVLLRGTRGTVPGVPVLE